MWVNIPYIHGSFEITNFQTLATAVLQEPAINALHQKGFYGNIVGEIIFFQLEFMTIFALTLLSWLRPAKATLVTFLPIFFGLMMDKWKEYTVANTAFTYVEVLPFCYLFLDEKARQFPLELHWRSRCIWYIWWCFF